MNVHSESQSLVAMCKGIYINIMIESPYKFKLLTLETYRSSAEKPFCLLNSWLEVAHDDIRVLFLCML